MASTAVVIGYGLYRRELPWLFVTWLLRFGLTPKLEGEDQEEGESDEETRECAKVPKKRPTVDMPSAAQERVFRKRR